MTPEARKMLDAIDAFLVRHIGTKQAQELWDVLSALRGPDADDIRNTAKRESTIPIRRAAFPALARQEDWAHHTSLYAPAAFGWPELKFTLREPDVHAYEHFHVHAYAAAEALGLK